MKNLTTAALLLLSLSVLAPQASFAGKPDRNPSEKDCAFMATTESLCTAELETAYNNIDGYLSQAEPVLFLSGNAVRDAGTLQCKLSGAELKLGQGKADEASYLIEKVIAKIWSLFSQGKLHADGLALIEADANAAKTCISDNYIF
jgi:hypothetical protein